MEQNKKTIEICLVIERLKRMKPYVDLAEFDANRKNDCAYCVEWGMDKQQWLESFVYQRFIDDLEEMLIE